MSGKRGLETTITGSSSGLIASVTDIRLGGGSVNYDDISTLADTWITYVADQIEPGNVSLSLQFDENDLDDLYDYIGEFQTWIISDDDGNSFSFSAANGLPEIDWARRKEVGVSVELKISGQITFTKGT